MYGFDAIWKSAVKSLGPVRRSALSRPDRRRGRGREGGSVREGERERGREKEKQTEGKKRAYSLNTVLQLLSPIQYSTNTNTIQYKTM